MEDDIKRKLREQNKNLVVYNLANEEIIPKFKALLGKFDTFLIVAQGNLNEEKIAGLKAKNVIALLKEDLDLENQNIPNLELFCCCMGQAEKFREKLKNGLMGVVSNIITYTTLLSATERGKHFIVESNDDNQADLFYSEKLADLFTVIDQVPSIECVPSASM